MYVVNDDLSIYCTRGDYCHIPVQHQFQPGDVVRFKAFRKKDCNTVVIQRDFTVDAEAENFVISLTGTDTKIGEVISKPVDYWYEVELNPETNPQTIIGYDEDGAKVFKLFPEGKDVDADDIEVVGTKTLQELVDYALSQAKESGEFNGADGEDGADGYTPEKGTDYFTEEDKAEIVNDVAKNVLPLCSNAFKATASGEIVYIDDISPIEHIVKATVSGKNLIPTFTQDYSVTRGELTQSCEAGGNTITINGIGNANGGGRNNFRDFSQHFFLKKGRTYTLSLETVSGSCDGVFSVYISKTPDSDSVAWTSNSMEQKTFVAQDDMECYIGVNVVADVVYNNVVVRFQLEEGDTATEYEPYIDPTTVTITRYGADETDNLQTFTPEADGTCNIPSLYPTMTLLTDTAGVTIECEYNRDSNFTGDKFVKTLVVVVNDENVADATAGQVFSSLLNRYYIVMYYKGNYFPLSFCSTNCAIFSFLYDDYTGFALFLNNDSRVYISDLAFVSKEEYNKDIGDIETALDSIIAIQNELMGVTAE